MTQSSAATTAPGILSTLVPGEENLRLMAGLRHLGRAAERRRVAEGMSR